MAVIGGECGRLYFSAKAMICESALAMDSSANNRAFSDSDSPLAADAARAAACQGTAVCTVQKIAAAVWSAVRVVLLRAPILLTSSKSRANCAVAMAGGPFKSRPVLLRSTNGVTVPHC